jgi:hypothetical protein
MNEKFYIMDNWRTSKFSEFLFWSRIKRIEKDVDDKKEILFIEKNYLSAFEVLHNKLSEVEKNIYSGDL